MLASCTEASQKSPSPIETSLAETEMDPSTKSKQVYLLESHIIKPPLDDPEAGKVAYSLFVVVHTLATNLLSHTFLFVS